MHHGYQLHVKPQKILHNLVKFLIKSLMNVVFSTGKLFQPATKKNIITVIKYIKTTLQVH